MSTAHILFNDDDPPVYYTYPSEGHTRSHHPRRMCQFLWIASCLVLISLLLFLLMFVFTGPFMDNSCSWSSSGWFRHICRWRYRRSTDSQILLISMDGFRHDYIELVKARYGPKALPAFDRIIQNGSRALHSVNAYPTITMPNHRTLLTGLYPQHHGVVGNRMLDSKYPDLLFDMNNQTGLNVAPWLDNWPEPVWVTVQKAGGLVGSLLWPFTDGQVSGDKPFQQVSQFTLLSRADSRYSYNKRVNDLLWWLNNPRYQLDLTLAYFDEPDETGHAYGPNSTQVADVVQHLDRVLGQLLDGIHSAHLDKSVDIIITADHGMTEISDKRLIRLDNYVSRDLYNYTQLSTMGFLYPKKGYETELYTKLKKVGSQLGVYKLNEVPASLHFNVNNSRMPPFILIPADGWYLVQNTSKRKAGDHGYPMNFTDMLPFFLARGPSFRVNHTVDEVHSVDVYPLICSLLGVTPNPNNGSLERIAKMLKPEVAARLLNGPAYMDWLLREMFTFRILVIFFTTLCACSICITAAFLCVRHRRSSVVPPSRMSYFESTLKA